MQRTSIGFSSSVPVRVVLRLYANPSNIRSWCTGTGGLSVAHQIYNRFKAAQQSLNDGDIAILDAAEYHYYQVRTRLRFPVSADTTASPDGEVHPWKGKRCTRSPCLPHPGRWPEQA
jgi:hypothetical protein